MSGRTQDIKNKVSDTMTASQQKVSQSLDTVQNQLAVYGNQIREYLNGMQADIEGYRFAVEKVDNGLTVDVLFKATIKGNQNTTM
jgi:hypothetical protein